jgi:hypothetical protein
VQLNKLIAMVLIIFGVWLISTVKEKGDEKKTKED